MLPAIRFNLDQSKILLSGNRLRYSEPEVQIFHCVISDISIVLWEATLTISDSIESFFFSHLVKGERSHVYRKVSQH